MAAVLELTEPLLLPMSFSAPHCQLFDESFASDGNSGDQLVDFEFSDFLSMQDESYDLPILEQQQQQNLQVCNEGISGSSGWLATPPPPPPSLSSDGLKSAKRVKMDAGTRIGFKTKSDVEILDDGYKWRKYGKKSVKNSPNPRNYYKCSSEGCGVKKRVERDREDASYVITTYEGVHNHTVPGAAVLCYALGDGAGGTVAWAASAPYMGMGSNPYSSSSCTHAALPSS